jgi:hypothetical protein
MHLVGMREAGEMHRRLVEWREDQSIDLVRALEIEGAVQCRKHRSAGGFRLPRDADLPLGDRLRLDPGEARSVVVPPVSLRICRTHFECETALAHPELQDRAIAQK